MVDLGVHDLEKENDEKRIVGWLTGMGMEKYWSVFRDNEFHRIDAVLRMEREDLERIGSISTSHVKQILKTKSVLDAARLSKTESEHSDSESGEELFERGEGEGEGAATAGTIGTNVGD